MPRRKQTSRKTLGFDKTGRYFRNLGYVRSAAGKYSQKKFYLGYDENLAKLAVARLESLWKRLEELHAAALEVKLTPRRHEFPIRSLTQSGIHPEDKYADRDRHDD